jgi:hypothetical protein
LLPVLPHDRGGRFEANADGSALALGANPLTTSSGVYISLPSRLHLKTQPILS